MTLEDRFRNAVRMHPGLNNWHWTFNYDGYGRYDATTMPAGGGVPTVYYFGDEDDVVKWIKKIEDEYRNDT